eukprot:TRINITY_DN3325_c0_g2_i1.p1 TRINITY_DN3325_c0_g2~~TRINITY_DN3325_c0_g2_i1.p1  ORF type:complete len:481 (+),score=63.13 TRINITY_DN3325_c0_g2_i1:20-1462(+)
MKLSIGVCIILLATCFAASPPYAVHWFNQTLDHFNFQTQPQTFSQRYLVWDKVWNKQANGPIFFYTGNEGDIVSFWDNTGFVFDIAPEFGALVVFAEHRFYGESYPFGPVKSFDYIGLLTVEQALADYAVLLDHLTESLDAKRSPIVAFGGSYGGQLTTWIRMKYPFIVDAALASSAPFGASYGFNFTPGFFEAVTQDFAKSNPACPNIARAGFSHFLQLAKLGQVGYLALTEIFSVCEPITTPAQANHLLLWIYNSFASIGMVDYPYPADFLAPLPAWPIRVACDYLLNARTPIEGLAQAAALFYNGTGGNLKCFDIYEEFVECADQTGCGTGPDGKSWDYQVCTELIDFPSTNNVTDMFPPRTWDLENLTEYCVRTWGVTPRPNWLATYFGGTNFKPYSRIIFSNGLLDPWHGGGVLTSLSDSLVAIIIPDGAHHLDLRESNPADPPSVIAARNLEKSYLRKWISEAQAERLIRYPEV